jgi:hypothetical protein
MKLGTENKRKTQIAGGLLVVAILLFVRMMVSGPKIPSAPPPAARAANATSAAASTQNARIRTNTGSQDRTLSAILKPSLDPRLRLDLLTVSEGVEYKGSGRDIFHGEPDIPQPVAPGRTDQRVKVQTPNPGPPPPPPIDLKFFGYATHSGRQKSIFLAQGDSVFTAREGDIVAGRYRVMKINPTSVEIRDVLSNNTQTIPLTRG